MYFYVTIKHGDTIRHEGICAALFDIFDCYVNAHTRIVVSNDTGIRRIIGPNH